ncbi:helix-turn-helix domain-containing protein [Streptomyces sp. NPDC004726]
MPRWKALPDELDPDVREFAEQLRRLVDQSGLSIPEIADRTGYGKTSWERYLDGRIFAPKGAITALAEVTDAHTAHLMAMWELAERAWNLDEARRDRTIEHGPMHFTAGAGSRGAAPGRGHGGDRGSSHGSSHGGADPGDKEDSGLPGLSGDSDRTGDVDDRGTGTGTAGAGAGAGEGTAGTGEGAGAGGSPASRTSSWNAVLGDSSPLTPPPGPYPYPAPGRGAPGAPGAQGGPGTPAVPRTQGTPAIPGGSALPGGSGAPGATGPASASGGGRRAARSGSPTDPGKGTGRGGHGRSQGGTGGQGGHGSGSSGGGSGSGGPADGKRKIIMFLAGAVGALVVIAAAVFLTDLGGVSGDKTENVAKTPTPSSAPTTSAPRKVPATVKCVGKECLGQDPEAMGCGGEFAKTVSRATVGKARVEVRFSEVCQAAWARITDGGPGDAVRISVGGKGVQKGLVNAESDAYTPMTASKKGTDAKACATLTTGTTGCTAVEQ